MKEVYTMWMQCEEQHTRPDHPFRYSREQYQSLEQDRNFWKLLSIILIVGLIIVMAAFLWALGPV